MTEASDNSGPGTLSLAPGSRLQREREKHGWSLVEAAERMHLDPWAIEALEANRFESVGPAVFAKGHLRQYAIILGVPTAEILSAYEGLRQAAPPATAPAPIDAKAAMPAMPSIAPPTPVTTRLLPIGGAVITVLVLTGALLTWKAWRPAPAVDPAPLPSAGAAGVALSAAAPSATDDFLETQAPAAKGAADAAGAAAAGPVAANAQGAGRARLRMSFSADSWVEVREAGGAMLYRGKGPANSVKVVAGVAPLTIYLGYVSGVQLEINHHAVAIGPQFVHGDVARFDAGADGVLRRSPRT